MANSSIKLSERSSAVKLSFGQILPSDFFVRNTVEVAKDLLGKVFIVGSGKFNQIKAVRIVETEAYRADDPASHSARGMTERCSVMFGPPGVSYVYLIYGMYSMLNFVTEPEGRPGAVLVRAVEPIITDDKRAQSKTMTSGPGRLTRYLGISRSDNGISLQGPRFRVLDDGFTPTTVLCSERVGISHGKSRLWRFFMAESLYVSSVKENHQARKVKRFG